MKSLNVYNFKNHTINSLVRNFVGIPCLSKHVYWFGLLKNKHIVLSDMLLKDARDQRTRIKVRPMSDDEIVAIISHELGHWKLKHTLYEKALYQVFNL